MGSLNRWLNWTPGENEIIQGASRIGLTKLTKPDYVSFVSAIQGEAKIIRGPEACPYPLPGGVRLVRYTPKTPPIMLTVCSVVTEVDRFIRQALGELAARLHHPLQIKAGDSVFELLSKLADCGLELRLEWPPVGEMRERSQETEPTEPAEPLPEPDLHPVDTVEDNRSSEPISDEELPF
jgi:hypothetical protein